MNLLDSSLVIGILIVSDGTYKRHPNLFVVLDFDIIQLEALIVLPIININSSI